MVVQPDPSTRAAGADLRPTVLAAEDVYPAEVLASAGVHWREAPPMTHTPDEIAAMIERLEAWEPLVSSGYEVPAAGRSMFDAAAMLRDVAAERDRYRDLAAKTHKANMATMGAEVKAEAERDRLAAMVEKLRGYAVHDDDCGVNALLMPRLPLTKQCTCGLSDVLKESGRV